MGLAQSVAGLFSNHPPMNKTANKIVPCLTKPLERQISHIEQISLSENEVITIIRPELNLEKFSNFIFPHRKSR